jgi:serine/threonine protein kinase
MTGIALAMRYVHSKGVIHRKLTPENILLDWDWNGRIANFSHSISTTELPLSPMTATVRVPPADAHYVFPESYEHIIGPELDVFSFGLILYELIGHPVFPKDMLHEGVA